MYTLKLEWGGIVEAVIDLQAYLNASQINPFLPLLQWPSDLYQQQCSNIYTCPRLLAKKRNGHIMRRNETETNGREGNASCGKLIATRAIVLFFRLRTFLCNLRREHRS